MYSKTVDGIEIPHRQTDEFEYRPRIFSDIGRKDCEKAQTVEAVDQKTVAEAVRESGCDVFEKCIGMASAVHLVDFAEVVQAEADEGKGRIFLLQFLQFDFRTFLACKSCDRIDDKIECEARDAAGKE